MACGGTGPAGAGLAPGAALASRTSGAASGGVALNFGAGIGGFLTTGETRVAVLLLAVPLCFARSSFLDPPLKRPAKRPPPLLSAEAGRSLVSP